MPNPFQIALMGPTASGKTDLAIRLYDALRDDLPLEIISVDSALVYQGMDIGTAKPNAHTLTQYPHALINIRSVTEPYSVADFCEDAKAVSSDIKARGHHPLFVGGTMMYFKALQTGLSQLPAAHMAVRKQLEAMRAEQGLGAVYEALKTADPKTAQILHPNDAQRILRALEVCLVTQKPYSAQLHTPRESIQTPWLQIALFPQDRAWLHARIAQRFELMLAEGFLSEVQTLMAQYPEDLIDTPAFRCVGYRQAMLHLTGQDDLNTFKAKAIAATRQLAKRQLTWLRSWPNAHYVDPQSNDCFAQILELIEGMLDNHS